MSVIGRTKSLVESLFPGGVAAYWRLRERYDMFSLRREFMTSVFTEIYQRNSWASEESVSGPGSNLARTTMIRHELPILLEQLHAQSLLDAGCGDFHWIGHTSLPIARYIGADVVPELMARNRKRYGSPDREFIVLDISRDELPAVDVILCRDCMIHLSIQHIQAAIRNFRRSRSTYLLATTHTTVRTNREILTGQWRPVNLQLPPFHFPEPARSIVEDPEWGKCLGLWRLGDL